MTQRRGFGLTTKRRDVLSRRFGLSKLITWLVLLTASATAGYLMCAWIRTSQKSSVQTSVKQNDQSFRHQPTPTDLTSPEFRRLKREALRGSKAAALKVMTAYEECIPPGGIGSKVDQAFVAECDRSFEHWVTIAATNGVGEAANLVFNRLSASDLCEDIYRARFWSTRIPWWGEGEPWKAADMALKDKERRCGW
jgi:hypothetical protein